MRDIRVRQHEEHARHGARRREVADGEARVRMGAAHDHAGGRARRQDVGGVAAFAGDQALVLDAPDALADTEFLGEPSSNLCHSAGAGPPVLLEPAPSACVRKSTALRMAT